MLVIVIDGQYTHGIMKLEVKYTMIQNTNQLNIYLKTIFKPMVSNLLTIGFLSEIE